ncbi:MAG: adenosylcobinamide-GDP ribazoletransferase, partial [Alphaproteobacteria bacterium]
IALARFVHARTTGHDDTSRRAAMGETVGPAGLLALFFVVGLKLAALATLPAPIGLLALVAAVAAGRAAMAVAAARLRPLPDDAPTDTSSLAPSLAGAALAAGYARPGREVIATAVILGGAIVLLMLGPLSGVLALAAAALIAWLAMAAARNAVGGYTDLVLATIAGLVEAAVLVSAAIV